MQDSMLNIGKTSMTECQPSKCREQREICAKLFDSEFKVILERLNGMDKALEKQHEVLEHRLQGLNELREEVTRDRNKFVLKDTYEIISDRVSKLENRSVVWITLIGIGFAVLQVVLRFWK